jgi:hypothetical protein
MRPAARGDEHHVSHFLGQHPVAVPVIEVDACRDLQPRARKVTRAVGEVILPFRRYDSHMEQVPELRVGGGLLPR